MQVTDSFGCAINSDTVNVIVLGIDNEENELFSIYPNPTKGTLSIVHNLKGETYVLKIVDLLGTTVYSENINTTENFVLVNVTQLANGIYLVVLSNTETNEQIVKKLVIQE